MHPGSTSENRNPAPWDRSTPRGEASTPVRVRGERGPVQVSGHRTVPSQGAVSIPAQVRVRCPSLRKSGCVPVRVRTLGQAKGHFVLVQPQFNGRHHILWMAQSPCATAPALNNTFADAEAVCPDASALISSAASFVAALIPNMFPARRTLITEQVHTPGTQV